MLGSIGNMLGAAKDRAAEAAAKSYINGKINKFGSLHALNIDSRQKTIFVEAQLNGEVAPVSLQIRKYDITQKETGSFITIREVTASRPWISAALQEFVVGREFQVPPAAASVL